MRKRTRPHVLLVLLALALAGPAGAAELFLSEIVEGSSNNKAGEGVNGTGAAVDLAAAGYPLGCYVNGSAPPGGTLERLGTLAAGAVLGVARASALRAGTLDLVGTRAAGDAHVTAHSSSVQAILDEADQTSGVSWFNGDDTIVLLKGDTVLDVVGQIGFDPGTQWGSGMTSTAD